MPPILCKLVLCASLGLASSVHSAAVRVLAFGDDHVTESPGFRGALLDLSRESGLPFEFVGPFSDTVSRHGGFGGFTIGPGPSKADEWSDGKGNLYAQAEAVLEASKPDVVLLFAGTMDFFNIGDLEPSYNPARDGPARLANLIDRIHALRPGARVLYANILPAKWDAGFGAEFNRKLPFFATGRPFARLVDVHQFASLEPEDWTPENKLGESGQRKLADALWKGLLPLLKTPASQEGQ